MPQCRLCLLNKPLKKSHIIPEFFYKNSGIYGDGSEKVKSFVQLSINNDTAGIHAKQKGLRENLLCSDCEQFLNDKYEKYAYELIFKKCNLINYEKHLEIQNAETDKIKLFVLSILWRAAVAKSEFWENINLLPDQEENLRCMILNQNAGYKTDFGCFIMIANENKKFIAQQILDKPKIIVQSGHRIAIFNMFGMVLSIFLSKHTNKFRFQELLIGNQNEIIIPKLDFDPFVTNLTNELSKSDYSTKINCEKT